MLVCSFLILMGQMESNTYTYVTPFMRLWCGQVSPAPHLSPSKPDLLQGVGLSSSVAEQGIGVYVCGRGKFPSLCPHPRRQREGWGTDLDNDTAQETWIPCESRKHLNSCIESCHTIPAYLGDVRQHNMFYVSKQGDQNLILFTQRQNCETGVFITVFSYHRYTSLQYTIN